MSFMQDSTTHALLSIIRSACSNTKLPCMSVCCHYQWFSCVKPVRLHKQVNCPRQRHQLWYKASLIQS